MNYDIIIVLGQMRSGTSAVSEVIHTLGIPMGVAFLAPIAPTYRLEWEDWNLTAMVDVYWRKGIIPGGGLMPWWKRYLEMRRQFMERAGAQSWGFKSPPWSLLADTLLPETRKAGRVAVIRVDRPQQSIDVSVEASFPASLVDQAKATNERIRQKLEAIQDDYRVHYDNLTRDNAVSDRREVVEDLAEFLAIEDPERIADAVSRVKGPTSGTHCSSGIGSGRTSVRRRGDGG